MSKSSFDGFSAKTYDTRPYQSKGKSPLKSVILTIVTLATLSLIAFLVSELVKVSFAKEETTITSKVQVWPPQEMKDLVVKYSEVYRFPTELVILLVEYVNPSEQSNNYMALSPQFVQEFASKYYPGLDFELGNPEKNIQTGVAYLAFLRKRYQSIVQVFHAWFDGQSTVGRLAPSQKAKDFLDFLLKRGIKLLP